MKKLLTHTLVLTIATAITVSTFAQSPSKATRQRRTSAEGTQPGSDTPADKSSEVQAGTDKTKSAPDQQGPTTADKSSEVKPATDKSKSAPDQQGSDAVEKPSEVKPATDKTITPTDQQNSDAALDKASEVKTSTDKTKSAPEVTADGKTNRKDQESEEESIVPYYNNFFTTYRLGPEDVISVNVFGQDRYSRVGIKIPPSGRIYLALIPEGIFVNGKTADQVAELIKKRYDEFIITPQVSVSLDQAGSYRYSVVGDVAVPGIKLMSRRLSVAEAVAEAGGVLQTGNRSKIVVLRKQPDGMLKAIPVNLSAVYKGQAPDSVYLVPGDQVIIPGNRWKSLQKIMGFAQVLSFATMFRGGW